jgi:hypothetical protein
VTPLRNVHSHPCKCSSGDVHWISLVLPSAVVASKKGSAKSFSLRPSRRLTPTERGSASIDFGIVFLVGPSLCDSD